MADRVINVLTPADNYDLLSLAELKAALQIGSADTSQDVILQQYIDRFSDVVATICNRVFAYETVSEIWRAVGVDCWAGMKRLYLSHWPIDLTATLTLQSPTGSTLDPSTYVVDSKAGKVELLQTWAEPITVTYSGGYDLPEAAPPAIKEATELMIREAQALAQRLLTSGIRSLSHKDSRVMFFDPRMMLKTQTLDWTSSPANALLMHFTRLEV